MCGNREVLGRRVDLGLKTEKIGLWGPLVCLYYCILSGAKVDSLCLEIGFMQFASICADPRFF